MWKSDTEKRNTDVPALCSLARGGIGHDPLQGVPGSLGSWAARLDCIQVDRRAPLPAGSWFLKAQDRELLQTGGAAKFSVENWWQMPKCSAREHTECLPTWHMHVLLHVPPGAHTAWLDCVLANALNAEGISHVCQEAANLDMYIL